MAEHEPTKGKYRNLSRGWWLVLVIFSAMALAIAINQMFLLRLFGFELISVAYYYWLIAVYVSLVFIILPATKSAPRNRIPWYDCGLFFLCLGLSLYFAYHAMQIATMGWEFVAPTYAAILGAVLWFLVLEACRRANGWVLALFVAFFSFYPLFAEQMPGFLSGAPFSFLNAARFHSMSNQSILGIPMTVTGDLLIGYMLFGIVLQVTGGGKFFIDLASALVGSTRGGPAKMAVIGSGLFGSMSGSAIANVATIGSMTIPAMKKVGYSPVYAAAIEACTSTGGVLMPPIMGAVAFVMASFMGVSYVKIAVAAVIPSVLYYLGLLIQVDAYAARVGLQGLPRNEIPRVLATLKEGWLHILGFIALVYFLFALRNEGQAPFYAIAVMLICAMIRKQTRFTLHSFLDFIATGGKFMAELAATLAAVGLIIGSFSMTGVAHSFSREIVGVAGSNWVLLLMFGALTSFILGMGMTVTACYIFLVIVLVPALVTVGLDPFAVHFFVMYWGMISYITPPVALAAITAASIAGADAQRVGYKAMQLGIIIYIIPFFFVLNPSLLMQGSAADIVLSAVPAIIGVILLAGAAEGYVIGMGVPGTVVRVLVGVTGMMFLLPPTTLVPSSGWSHVLGVVMLVLLVAHKFVSKRLRLAVSRKETRHE